MLKRAQALRAARIDFFQDILSLQATDRWRQRIYRKIDDCDLFLLFWSRSHVNRSGVHKELQYALAKQSASRCRNARGVCLPPKKRPDRTDARSARCCVNFYSAFIHTKDCDGWMDVRRVSSDRGMFALQGAKLALVISATKQVRNFVFDAQRFDPG